MGQSLKKFAPGSEEKKIREIGPIIESCYYTRFRDSDQMQTIGEFYHGVCWTVEQINHHFQNTQFKLPTIETLQEAYMRHHRRNGGSPTKQEFENILREVITDTGFTGIGAKEALLCIFGVPLTTLFLKQRIVPRAIPDELFIPAITSITVLLLAALNKI